MNTSADGSPVELYALLPDFGEAALVHASTPAGGSVLELGAGAGRVTEPIAALGHPVVAVDNSGEMLGHVRNAETVRADIETLRLDRRFDTVVLASHLVNTPDAELRRALLATAAHHAAGRVLVQWHPAAWFDTVDSVPRPAGPVEIAVRDIVRDGDLLSATVHYDSADRHWEHAFTAQRLSIADLELAQVGLRFDGWLTEDQTWFAARPNHRSNAASTPSADDAQAT
ncbi:class I SAM-dependent methyltransferase [Kutzneria buriramensis]|uniref:class I SAM-dependent methyltransferase n=1 Tax=Kutzneria buriramensis TaxID=1045776 RepID=UPI001FE9F8EB|nr:class I SAM-dependent methyltransferase [Kutzneria buriramensis]